MAGIGFELRKILQKDSLAATARAHFLGGIIVLGPFLCSVLCLLGLNLLSVPSAGFWVRQTFASAVVYVFGGSLVASGPLQVVLTRYLADKVYRGEYATLIESLFPVLMMTIAVLAVPALFVLAHVDLSMLAKLALLSLHLTVGCLWMVVVFVRAAQGHKAVALIFFIGSAAALGLGSALVFVPSLQLEGLLLGYAAGHMLLLVLLIRRLIVEFGYPRRWDFRVLGYVRLFPMLVFIGLLQNLGIWIDKFVFWGSELALEVSRFVTAPKYDSSTFLAYLTALPAFVVFFVRVETDFHDQFHRYYDEIFFRGSLDAIADAAASLRRVLEKALLDILKVQAVVTFLSLYFAMELLQLANLPVSQVGMFRFGIVGSFFLAFMMFANVILLYLDRQQEVLATTLVFFLSNLTFTLCTLTLGYQFYGLGFAAACAIGVLTSLFFLANQLYNLEYMTFGLMPVTGRRKPSRSLRAGTGSPHYGVVRPLADPKKEP
jgi:polysaccharide biosynthesis protein PelG